MFIGVFGCSTGFWSDFDVVEDFVAALFREVCTLAAALAALVAAARASFRAFAWLLATFSAAIFPNAALLARAANFSCSAALSAAAFVAEYGLLGFNVSVSIWACCAMSP